MRKVCLLLTACVNPNGMIFTELQDSSLREKQYKEALSFYLEETNFPIVFVENTLCDFSSLYSDYIKSGRLEYFTFDGNQYDRKRGKGYGEAIIMKYALEHSQLISNCDYIVKITGRLIIKNINDLASSFFIVKKKYLLGDLSGGYQPFIRSMVLGANKEVIRLLSTSLLSRVNDSQGIYFEHVLYDVFMSSHITSLPFGVIPQIEGYSGSSNFEYKEIYKNVQQKDILYIYHLMMNKKGCRFLSLCSLFLCRLLTIFQKLHLL